MKGSNHSGYMSFFHGFRFRVVKKNPLSASSAGFFFSVYARSLKILFISSSVVLSFF